MATQSPSVSLLEVMSEQMVAKMSTEEIPGTMHYTPWSVPEVSVKVCETDDYFLAVQLQEQEYAALKYHKRQLSSSPTQNAKVWATSHLQEYGHIITSKPNKYQEEYEDTSEFGYQKPHTKVGGRYSRFEQKAREKKDKKFQKTEMKTPTFEGIDGFSRKILYSLQTNLDIFSKINGCVAQGKEAVIHHAIGGNNVEVKFGLDYAVKIYKTTKVEFRDREQYIEGEWRFRDYQVVKNNPRKMIILWAEKELRNLKRLRSHGILCPEPILLRKHILVMSFIGKDGYPAPQLENANLTPESMKKMYWNCAKLMRRMYKDAGLVHADLSPYNILVFGDNLYIIDLAQAVMTNNAHAPEFLRRDCYNMTKFFRSRRIPEIMETKELFDFITNKEIQPNGDEEYIQNIKLKLVQRAGKSLTKEELIEEQVWLNISLPTTLKDVTMDKLLEAEGVYFSALNLFVVNESDPVVTKDKI